MFNANNNASIEPTSIGAPVGSANTGPGTSSGQPAEGADVVSKTQYDELFSKLGTMGQEVGEYRTFFQSISPLLEKLDQSPELVQAIIDGKIDKNLAQAAYEGRISISDAQIVSAASAAVQSEAGKKAYEAMDPKQIERLIENKADEIRKEFEEKSDLKSFEEKTQKFIESTSDFIAYADAVDKWIDSHDVTDIEVAYYAVKGQLSEEAAKKAATDAAAERGYDLIANASGGGITSQATADDIPLIDRLVGGSRNPLL